ncbi:hypothetical protein GXW78_26400 [Roseomonas terrae]|jgi:hypothetical protein|uniref:DUF2946 domain-containing protein n=1 Tax=Neoroseomonas terrae TaxID=424799 RepID=A0ABS5EQB7_9PROT|nr:hypothetical protein [Neoroseomonas terrae]MBR0653214.1 hypothetical protein [Neoroseomonas terrae]
MKPVPDRFLLRMAVLAVALGIAAPVAAQVQPNEEGRCWVALRVSGPEAMRTTEEEARTRVRVHCRPGDILVFLTDTGQPFGPAAAQYCDMTRPVLIERSENWRSHDVEPHEQHLPPVGLMTCTYRGGPRPDR